MNVIPITTVEQNHEVWHSNSSDKWDIILFLRFRITNGIYSNTSFDEKGGGRVGTNYRGRGGPGGGPGSDYVAYVVFSAVLLVDCAFNPSSLSPNHSATDSFFDLV